MAQRQPSGFLQGTDRLDAAAAFSTNVDAGRAIAELVRTTLGPRGMDKLLVDQDGMALVTNTGRTILGELDVEHPGGRLLRDAALAQNAAVGDGTTTAVLLAGILLSQAADLRDRGLHPTTVVNGYRLAATEARTTLDELRIESGDPPSEDQLTDVAATAMSGRAIGDIEETIAEHVVEAALSVTDDCGFDESDVAVRKITGRTVTDATVLAGLILDEERVTTEMPPFVDEPRIALLDAPIEKPTSDRVGDVDVADPDLLERFRHEETDRLAGLVDRLAETGATVIATTGMIDDAARRLLAARGIYGVHRISDENLRLLSRATGATIHHDPTDVTSSTLGGAGEITERDVDNDRKTVVADATDAGAVTLVLYGSTRKLIDEVGRAVDDALQAVGHVIEGDSVVPGGGATEIELANTLQSFASTVGDRRQLAVEEFANALEIVPYTLAENAGRAPVDMLLTLYNRHDEGQRSAGVTADGEIVDMWEAGVLEPRRVKAASLANAVEAVTTILRIDDVLLSTDGEENHGG